MMKRSRSQDPDDVVVDLDDDDHHNTEELVETQQNKAHKQTTPPNVPANPHNVEEKRCSLRQTKLSLGISMDDSLRKDLAARNQRIEELTARVQQLESEAARTRTLNTERQEKGESTRALLQRYQNVLWDVMLEDARTKRREARRAAHNLHFELGQILTCQTPSGTREMWVEGNCKRELDKRQAQITSRIAEIEGLKTTLSKRKQKGCNQRPEGDDTSNGFSISESIMSIEEQMQMYKAEMDSLNAAKEEVKQQIEELEMSKSAFLKEIRRINDEDASSFASEPAIHDNRYVLISLLGKGGFSEVWKAFDLHNARYVACKIHRINKDWTATTRTHYLKHAERELEIMRAFNHPRLTRLYDVFEQDNDTFVSVQELSEGPDLDTVLKRNKRMREADARIIIIQLVAALRHLSEQSQPVIHYDLKPANILFHSALPSCLDIKVTDFGLSKVIQKSGNTIDPTIELTSQGTGTYWYLPPECFETNVTPMISSKVDIWAVGVIFYQMLFGKRPFAEGESQRRIWQDKLIMSKAREELEFPVSKNVSEHAKDFIRRCLTYYVVDRPDIVELSNDPYLRGKVSKVMRNYAPNVGRTTTSMAPPPSVTTPLAAVCCIQQPTAQNTQQDNNILCNQIKLECAA